MITAGDMREAERLVFEAEPGVDLMGRAAAEVARVAAAVAEEGPVLVVAGPGNNGGDGLYAAAILAGDRPVLVWVALGAAHAGGLEAALAAGCRQVGAVEAVDALAECVLVIDAVTGLGSRPGLPEPVATLAAACADLGVPVLSVDLPSGLDADSGAVHPSFSAAHTVTFATVKPCHVMEPAASRCGRVHVVDIGVEAPNGPLRQAEPADVARWWPAPTATSDKYARGVVMIDTGSEQYQGAAILGVSGALHAGAGMVRYTGRVASGLILSRFPSVVIGEGRAQAMVVGSGWGDGEGTEGRVANAGLHAVPTVVDADALYSLPAGRLENWLLTPHAGELARILGCTRSHVEAQPLVCVREVSRQTGAAVLLKGATQYVAEPSGRVTIAVRGPSWTAQAGSGDVLAGICGALLAAGLPAWRAGVVGASIQAMAAARWPGPRTPDELAALVPQLVADLLGG